MANIIREGFFKVSNISRSIGKNLFKADRERYSLLQKWNKLDAEKKFRISYDSLNEESVVFDLGGYEGQWASNIFAKYLCEIHVFEPHPVFFKNIVNRFKNNRKIKAYEFGIGSKDEQINFVTSADATSRYTEGRETVKVQLKNATTFLDISGYKTIDLMKINIEGGEYDLLEHLIKTNWVSKIKNLQIQFHHFIPNAKERMVLIQQALQKTHSPTYKYEFLWENWELKKHQ